MGWSRETIPATATTAAAVAKNNEIRKGGEGDTNRDYKNIERRF